MSQTGTVNPISIDLCLLRGFADAVRLLHPLRQQAFEAHDEFSWHKIWSAQEHLKKSQREIGEAYLRPREEAA